jgi:hypothetical protein
MPPKSSKTLFLEDFVGDNHSIKTKEDYKETIKDLVLFEIGMRQYVAEKITNPERRDGWNEELDKIEKSNKIHIDFLNSLPQQEEAEEMFEYQKTLPPYKPAPVEKKKLKGFKRPRPTLAEE